MATRTAVPKIDPEHIVKGVDQAMWAWLVQNSPVTVPGLIEKAAGRAFHSWLEANKATLLDMIAEKVARKMTERQGDAG